MPTPLSHKASKTFWTHYGKRKIILYLLENKHLLLFYCLGTKFVEVLTQDSVLLHGVIAYARTHYHAG